MTQDIKPAENKSMLLPALLAGLVLMLACGLMSGSVYLLYLGSGASDRSPEKQGTTLLTETIEDLKARLDKNPDDDLKSAIQNSKAIARLSDHKDCLELHVLKLGPDGELSPLFTRKALTPFRMLREKGDKQAWSQDPSVQAQRRFFKNSQGLRQEMLVLSTTIRASKGPQSLILTVYLLNNAP